MLALATGLLVVIALLNQLQGLASSALRTYTGENLVLAFRAQLFRHIQRLSLSYHDLRGTGDSVYRVQYDAPAIQWILIDGIIPFITAGFTLTGMVYVTARIDWQLALVSLAVAPVLFLVSQAYSRHMRSQWHEVVKLESSALSVVQEVLAAVRVVKAFGQEDREQERYVRHANQGVWARFRAILTEGGVGLLIGLITALGSAIVLFIGVRHVQAGTLTLGELLIAMVYLAQLYAPMQTISRNIVSLQASLVCAERAFSLLDEVPDVAEWPNARPLAHAKGDIAFRNVSFAYDGKSPVLHDISFEIGPGTSVGIAGTTGAGKTTLVSLLTRFYDPTTGQVLLAAIYVTTSWQTCAINLPSSFRSLCCSRRASRRISPTPARGPATAILSKRRRPPTPTSSSSASPRATRPWSGSAGCACRAASASASRLPVPS